ncbi:TIGR03915 family putative DNA repair protein [Anaerosporobacter faecicola]|uniref:TIGR03915 family putative DNA repair protein n=1 Tax=Anaerosporobacter faecicola TaxID=2718714 RepID=UPI001439E3D8|nr:TIGR03915 family putative DNA repair protein [Anaerosporobacter faecicola]
MEQYIFLCEDSIDGIFTAVYDAWASGYGNKNCKVQIESYESNYQLFSTYITVNTDLEKAEKVGRTIKKKMSVEAYESVCRAAMTSRLDKADVIYRFIQLGIYYGPSIITNYSNESVQSIFEMNRTVGNEVHHYLGFLRFFELKNKVLYAKINPKNNIVALLAPHFADRLPCENWIIHDEGRELAAVHQVEHGWVQVRTNDVDFTALGKVDSEEEDMENLWKAFVKSIAIMERTNLKLQRQNLPLRFRGNMTEFIERYKEENTEDERLNNYSLDGNFVIESALEDHGVNEK